MAASTDASRPKASKVARIAKSVFGVTLLSVLVYLAFHHGSALPHVTWGAFALTTLLTLCTLTLNAEILRLSLRAFGSDLPRGDAIWLTGIGTLGNAFGGIPFGTALKFTLLVKRFDMTTSSVFWTYFFYSVINAVVMFFAGALIARAAGYPVSLSGLLALPGALVAIGIFMVRNVQATRRIAPTALAALVDSPFLARTVCICVANVALMLGAFLTLLWGDTSWQSIASALVSVTVAVPIGFLTGLPSLGGLLEVLLGAVGLLFDFPMQHGIQLGLLLRAASVIAAAALVACAARHLVKAWRGRHLDR